MIRYSLKSVPAGQFSNKLFMMHGNLRVLEQKMLTHDGVDADVFNLVERICRTKAALLALGSRQVDDEQARRAPRSFEKLSGQGWSIKDHHSETSGGRGMDYPDGVSESVEEYFHRLCIARDALMLVEAALKIYLQRKIASCKTIWRMFAAAMAR